MATTSVIDGQSIHPDAIQRVLFDHSPARVCRPPPLTSTKGHMSATWKLDQEPIPPCRVRIVETAVPDAKLPSGEKITCTIALNVAETGEPVVFAEYDSTRVVEQALDSSRAFAILARHGRMTAVVGLVFEERGEAMDFSITLQQCRKTLGLEMSGPPGAKSVKQETPKKDYSLKEGETITVKLKGRRAVSSDAGNDSSSAGFSLQPPPGGGLLPPPPSAQEVKAQNRSSQTAAEESLEDMGFDDGEFGEFQ